MVRLMAVGESVVPVWVMLGASCEGRPVVWSWGWVVEETLVGTPDTPTRTKRNGIMGTTARMAPGDMMPKTPQTRVGVFLCQPANSTAPWGRSFLLKQRQTKQLCGAGAKRAVEGEGFANQIFDVYVHLVVAGPGRSGVRRAIVPGRAGAVARGEARFWMRGKLVNVDLGLSDDAGDLTVARAPFGAAGAENKDALWTAVSKITRPALQMSTVVVYGSPARTSGALVSMVPAIP